MGMRMSQGSRRRSACRAGVLGLLLWTGGESFGAQETEPDLEPTVEESTADTAWWNGDRLFGDWVGPRLALEERGIEIEALLTEDVAGLVSGGVDRGTYSLGAFELAFAFDLEALVGWKGAEFVVNNTLIGGHRLSKKVGDWQWTSNI